MVIPEADTWFYLLGSGSSTSLDAEPPPDPGGSEAVMLCPKVLLWEACAWALGTWLFPGVISAFEELIVLRSCD